MDLSEWLRLSQKTQQAFAAELGIKQPTLSMILTGKRTPSLWLAQKIQRETKGAVRVDDWKKPKKEGAQCKTT